MKIIFFGGAREDPGGFKELNSTWRRRTKFAMLGNWCGHGPLDPASLESWLPAARTCGHSRVLIGWMEKEIELDFPLFL
jgi:hypothetical protein